MALGPSVYGKTPYGDLLSEGKRADGALFRAVTRGQGLVKSAESRGRPAPLQPAYLDVANGLIDAASGYLDRRSQPSRRFAGDALYNWKPSAGLLPSGWNPSSTVFSGGVSNPIAFSDAMTFQPSFKVDTNVSSFWGS